MRSFCAGLLLAQAAAQLDVQGLLQVGLSVHGDTPTDADALWYPFAEKDGMEMDSEAAQRCSRVTPLMGTMKSTNKLQAVIDIMTKLHNDAIRGDVVEAGVAEGGGILPVIFYMGCTGDLKGRNFHLFDSWQGLPAATESEDKGFSEGAYHVGYEGFMANVNKYAEAYKANVVGKRFETGTPIASWEEVWSHVKIVKGLFADTMPQALAHSPVALLCCDGDMYISTKDCFDAAGPKLVKGATVYNDDYYTFVGCYKATQEFIQARQASGKHTSPVQLVPQGGDFRYFEEDSQCVPPTDNGAASGICGGLRSEAAVFTVS